MNESPSSAWHSGTLLKNLAIPFLLALFFAFVPQWQNSVDRDHILQNIEKDPNFSIDQKRVFKNEFKSMNIAKVCDVEDMNQANLAEQLEKKGYCDIFDYLELSFWISVVSLFLTTLTLWGTYLLAARGKHSPGQLLSNYRVAWYFNLTAMFVQLILQAPLAAYAVYEFTTLLFNRFFPQLIVLLLFIGGYAVYLCIRTLFDKLPMEFGEDFSVQIFRNQCSSLWQEIEDVARRLGAPQPENIVVGMSDSFYVTELGVRTSKGVTAGRTLFLSYPLMRSLTSSEVMAIVCHELGHFYGEDTKLTKEFYPFVYRVNRTLGILSSSIWTEHTAGRMLVQFAVAFKWAEQRISRERELAADRFGARYQDHRMMAQALVKVIALSHALHLGQEQDLFKFDGERQLNLIEVCKQRIASNHEFWIELGRLKVPHPLDSHPTLNERMKNLGVDPRADILQELASFSERKLAIDEWFPKEQELFGDMITEWYMTQSFHSPRKIDSTADEDQEIIRNKFPNFLWKAKPRRFWKTFCLLILFGFGMLATAFLIPSVIAQFAFSITGLFALFMAYFFYRNHYRGTISLDYEGLSYSGFREKVIFESLSNIGLNQVGGDVYLVISFKEKRKRLLNFILFNSLTATERILISDFNLSSEEIYKKVIDYFLRNP